MSDPTGDPWKDVDGAAREAVEGLAKAAKPARSGEAAAEGDVTGAAGDADERSGPRVRESVAAGARHVRDSSRQVWDFLQRMWTAYREPGRYHGKRMSLALSAGVVAALGFVYWFTQWPLPDLTSGNPDLNFYLIQPLLWLAVALLAVYGWLRLEDRPPFSRMLIGIALLVGIFHVAILVIAGVIWTFGDSPIAGRIINYPKNFWYIATLLAGAEAARAFLFEVWRHVDRRLAFGAVALILFAVAIPAGQWTPFEEVDLAFRIIGGRWAPALALSLLATFLVSYGGMGPSFAYRFALLGFEWFSPILPDLDWVVLLLIGVLVPMASARLVRSIYEETKEGAERYPAEEEPYHAREKQKKSRVGAWVSWGVIAAGVVLLVLFLNGTFGFYMVAIDGISMDPAYQRGDLAVVRENVDPDSLEVDDVIQFRSGGISIMHRIIAIEEGPGGRVFTTKGDNVDEPDRPITEDQIQGEVVFLLPEIGHVNLWIRGR